MEFNEALEEIITRAQAINEVKKHGCSLAEFLNEVGDKSSYMGSEVLYWLGY